MNAYKILDRIASVAVVGAAVYLGYQYYQCAQKNDGNYDPLVNIPCVIVAEVKSVGDAIGDIF